MQVLEKTKHPYRGRLFKGQISLAAALSIALSFLTPCYGQTPSATASHVNNTVNVPPGALPEVIVLDKGVRALPQLRPKESGVAATELTRRLRDSERRLRSTHVVERTTAKRPQITFACLEPFRVNGDWPRGAVSIEAALFPEIIYPPNGLREDELREKEKERKERRQVVWRWNVPTALRNGSMIPESGGGSFSEGGNRFFTVHITLNASAPDRAANNLYFFDATKGLLWQKDMLPLLQGRSQPLNLAGFATLRDSQRTVFVASDYYQTRDLGSRLIVLDPQGNVVSITDIPGVYIEHLRPNASGNSLLISGSVLFIEGKPFTGKPSSVDILVDDRGALVGSFTDKKGNFVAPRVDVLDNDKQAVSIEAGQWFEFP